VEEINRLSHREKDQQIGGDKSLSRFPLYDFRHQVSRLGRTFVKKSNPVDPFWQAIPTA
jgi:hypothetical protein